MEKINNSDVTFGEKNINYILILINVKQLIFTKKQIYNIHFRIFHVRKIIYSIHMTVYICFSWRQRINITLKIP